jgi:hypothetical protein
MSTVKRLSAIEELADFLARRPTIEEILAFRLSDEALDRARNLLAKNKDETLTTEESRELDRMIVLDDVLGLIRARALESRASDDGAGDDATDTAHST